MRKTEGSLGHLKIAVVIPAYNEERTVAGAVEVAARVGSVILVDDGSVDATVAEAAEAGAMVVRQPHNQGYDRALQAGFERALELGFEGVITFDADGEHRAEGLQSVCDLLKQRDVSLVIGVRDGFPRFSETLFNRWTGWRFGVPDLLCGLKGYRMELFEECGVFDDYGSIGTQLSLWALSSGKRCATVRIQVAIRADTPRLGAFLRGNWLILRAFLLGVLRFGLFRTR